MIGNVLRHPSDMSRFDDNDNPRLNVKQARRFAEKLKDRIEESTKIVQANLKKSRSQMKTSYDKRSTQHSFTVGDTVMMWDPPQKSGISKAFQPKWRGPWTIVRSVSPTNCQLCDEVGKTKYVHFNLLKKVEKRNFTPYLDNPIPSPPLKSIEPNSILSHIPLCIPVNEVKNVSNNFIHRQREMVDEDIFNFDELVPNEMEQINEEDDVHVPPFPIDNAYVDVDESNILEGRLRIRR